MVIDQLLATSRVLEMKSLFISRVAAEQGDMAVHLLPVSCWRGTLVMQGMKIATSAHSIPPRLVFHPIASPSRYGSAPAPGSSRVCPSKCCPSRCPSARTRDPKPQVNPAPQSHPARTRNPRPVRPPEVGDSRC